MEIAYQYYQEVEGIELQQSVELTIESFLQRDRLILDMAKVIKQIFPEVKLYKAISKELYYLLDATARQRRLNLIS